MTMTTTTSPYEPTPLEQSYGLFLAQQIFGISPLNVNAGVHISGRDAVLFLTRSSVDRTILRSLWNVADPQNVGSLSSIQQFHLLLRLVAMAQQSLIHNNHTVEDISTLVQDHATRPLSLPLFNGVIIPQPQSSLMTMYGQFLAPTTRVSLLGSVTTTVSIDEAFEGLVDVPDVAPLGGLNDFMPPSALEEQQPSAPSGIVEHRVSQVSAMSSLSDTSLGGNGNEVMAPSQSMLTTMTPDAFTDFGRTTDTTPLPTLQSFAGTSVVSNESMEGGRRDNAVETVSLSSQSGPVTASTFDSTTFMSGTTNASNMGEFVSIPLQPPQQQQSTATTATELIQEDDFDDDEFGGFSSALPTSTEASMMIPAVLETNPSLGATSVNTNNSTMDISDAFGGEVGVQDTPLPTLHSFDSIPQQPVETHSHDFDYFLTAPVSTNAITASSVPVVAVPDVEDDFGDFGSTIQPSITGGSLSSHIPSVVDSIEPKQSVVDQPCVTDLGRAFSEPVTSTPAVVDSGRSFLSAVLDPFDGLGPTQDTHSPTPGAFGTPLTSLPPGDEKEEYGDYANAVSTKNDDDDFGDFDSAIQHPDPVPLSNLSSANNMVDDFGDFEGVTPGVDNVADFCAFDNNGTEVMIPSVTDVGRINSEPVFSTIVQPTTIAEASRSLSIDDAFGNLPGLQDVPIPSLDMVRSSWIPDQSNEVVKTVSEDEDDDFGGFEQATPPENISDPKIDMAFTNNPENLHATIEPRKELAADVDKFGSSVIQPASQTSSLSFDPLSQPSVADIGRSRSEPVTSLSTPAPDFGIGRSLSIDDAFADMVAQEDTLLPSLESFGAISTDHSVAKDNEVKYDAGQTNVFGDFDQVENDTFGSFSAVRAPESASAQTDILFEVPAVTDTGRTQSEPSFFAPSNVAVGRSLSVSDVHDAPVQDSPMPSFDILGSSGGPAQASGTKDEDDDFGVFEEARSSDEADCFGDVQPSKPSEKEGGFTAFDSLYITPSAGSSEGHNFLTLSPSPHINNPSPSRSDPFAPVNDGNPQPDLFSGFGNDDTNNDDDFGAFADSTTPDKVLQEEPPMTVTRGEESANEFGGDFGGGNPITSIDEGEDDFGAFGSSEEGHDQNVPAQLLDGDSQLDAFGSGDEHVVTPTTFSNESKDDEFGSLDKQSTPGRSTDMQNDFFGDFGQAETTPDPFASNPPTDSLKNLNITSTGEVARNDVSDFATVEVPSQVSTTDEKDDDNDDFGDFGDFSSFEQAPTDSNTVPATTTMDTTTSKSLNSVDDDDDDNDWGDFENVYAPTTTTEGVASEVIRLRDRIRSLSLQLPETLLLKAGRSGEHVDLGEAFEVNFGVDSSLDELQRRRVERCIEVLEALSTDSTKLASTYWVQVLEVIHDEMDVSITVLNKATALPSSDFPKVEQPLSTLVAGLAEYMRITRSIVACLGDLLLLDETAMLTVDTLSSTWGSLTILEKALEIEEKWKSIRKCISGTSLRKADDDAVSLTDIRSRALSTSSSSSISPSDATTSHKLCELTLQPLWPTDRSTTQSEVTFQGKCFMACSANFLANRCPFYVVANDTKK